MAPPGSPRLPGVPLLQAQSTGPDYSRWRRGIRFALEMKGAWKYCNGKCTMPMPEAGATSPTGSTTNLQPGLLEERRNWVRNDREVKLDIFLSLAEDVMQEVFEDGPPLPPSNLTAQDMLEALDDRFAEFSFEAYHHAFCHFLNLHIGQYASIQEFNQEFLMTLEDLLDHGHPLSNVQACSAYFSKLRCTQNPWVIKKLEEWDAQAEEIDCIELLKEGGDSPWAVVRPLATKSSQNFQVDSIPEEYLEDSSASDSDRRSEQSCGSIVSSISSHPQQEPDTTEHTEPLQEAKAKRQASVATANSLEITVHVSSEDMPEVNTQTHNKEREMLPLVIPERKSSKDYLNVLSKAKKMESPLPEWLVSNQGVFGQSLPPPHNRPLPPIPLQAPPAKSTEPQPHSKPSRVPATEPKNSPQASPTAPTTSTPSPQPPTLHLETTHPTLHPQTPTPQPPLEVHPALRPAPSSPSQLDPKTQPAGPQTRTTRHSTPTPQHQRPVTSSTTLAIPWPSTPDIPPRPHSSRATMPFTQAAYHLPAQSDQEHIVAPETSVDNNDNNDDGPQLQIRHKRSDVSEISLPLQGTRDSAWEYLYESKGGYLVKPGRVGGRSVSPVSSASLLSQGLERVPTVEEVVVVARGVSPEVAGEGLQAKRSVVDFVARLSGDSLLESSEEVREKKQKKKRSWNVGVNLARFSASKGVKEIA